MTLESVLARGRVKALILMVDRCVIERETSGSFNSATGTYGDSWSTVYTGRCRLKGGGGSDSQFADHEVVLAGYQIILPWDTEPEILVNDRVTLTVCEDDWAVGRQWQVTDVGFNGISTARRITVQLRT